MMTPIRAAFFVHPLLIVTHHALDLQKILETELAVFAAIARLLVAAERRRGCSPRSSDRRAGAQALRHGMRMLDRGGLHIAREAVHAVVGHGDRFVFRRRYGRIDSTGPKISSRAMRHVRRHVGEHRRAHE